MPTLGQTASSLVSRWSSHQGAHTATQRTSPVEPGGQRPLDEFLPDVNRRARCRRWAVRLTFAAVSHEADPSAHPAPTLDRLLELGEELFRLGRDQEQFDARQGRASLAQVPAVFGVARHAIETGDAGLRLWFEGRQLVAVTLMRSALECAVTALWLVQSPEAIMGFVAEEYRQRRNLSREMAESSVESFRAGASQIAYLDEGRIETTAAPQAKRFSQLCETLNGGRDAYLYYRFESAMVHPTVFLTDYYVEEAPGTPAGCTLMMEPKAVGVDAWPFLTVASMMWANRALDHVSKWNPHRSRLRQIARELGVAETLELTEKARQEAGQSARDRRRATYKPPRQKRGQPEADAVAMARGEPEAGGP